MAEEVKSQDQETAFSGQDLAAELTGGVEAPDQATETPDQKAERDSHSRFYSMNGGRVEMSDPKFLAAYPPEEFKHMADTYQETGSMLCAYDKNGRMTFWGNTQENKDALASWGYTLSDQESLPAYMANGNTQDMEPMTADALRLMKGLTDIREGARNAGVKLGQKVEGQWMQYETGDEIEAQGQILTPPTGPSDEMRDGRLSVLAEEAGHYAANNGTLAFVDERGMRRFAPYTAAREAALQAAGYTPGGVGVPMSNGERFTGRSSRKQADWGMMQLRAKESQ